MPPAEPNDLEQLAARIADEQPVDWRELDEADTASVTGLREIEQLAQSFRHLQVSAVAPKTPTSNRFMFGNLQVLEPLGSGAQGDVWRAYDPLLDLQVALKLRKLESGVLSNQFLDEGRRLARVRQANIVSVYGAAIHGARAGIWSELVRGSPVSELLAGHGAFPPEEVRGIGLDLCHALAAVHRHGLVHGDVKCENVMREVSGRIVLMDFGAAREFELTDPGVVTGTLRYLAPEVLQGAPPSPGSDIYALGVLLFHLLTGEFPYAASELESLMQAQARGQRVRLAKLKPGTPRDLVRAVETALEADPARRHATALAFAAALAPQPHAGTSRWPLALAITRGKSARRRRRLARHAGMAGRGEFPARAGAGQHGIGRRCERGDRRSSCAAVPQQSGCLCLRFRRRRLGQHRRAVPACRHRAGQSARRTNGISTARQAQWPGTHLAGEQRGRARGIRRGRGHAAAARTGTCDRQLAPRRVRRGDARCARPCHCARQR